jgi:hypothetical protein
MSEKIKAVHLYLGKDGETLQYYCLSLNLCFILSSNGHNIGHFYLYVTFNTTNKISYSANVNTSAQLILKSNGTVKAMISLCLI